MKHHSFVRATAAWLMIVTFSLFLMPAFAQKALTADDIVGVWEADDGSVKLDMYKARDEFQAHLLYGNKLVESDNLTFKSDTKNPDPSLRSRSLKNIVFIWGLHWDGSGWSDGSLYDGSSGRTYHCKIEIEDGKMHLRGYIGLPALGQTKLFHRSRA